MINVRIANEKDEGDLQRLFHENDMKGSISVSLETPNFFESLKIYENPTVYIAQDTSTGNIIASSIVSEKSVFIGGKIEKIGYLSGLRIDKYRRGGRLLAKAFSMLKEIHENHPLKMYITTIMSDNPARNILESGRASLPKYHRRDTLDVFMIGKQKKTGADDKNIILRNGINIADAAIEYINSQNAKYDFAPALSKSFVNSLPGLSWENFYVAFKDSKPVGTVAVWKQTFKQTRITGYSKPLNAFRSLINVGLRLTNYPTLPKSGEVLNSSYLSFLNADTPEIMNKIIRQVSTEFDTYVFSFTHNDPRHSWIRNNSIRKSFEVYTIEPSGESKLDNPISLEAALL